MLCQSAQEMKILSKVVELGEQLCIYNFWTVTKMLLASYVENHSNHFPQQLKTAVGTGREAASVSL